MQLVLVLCLVVTATTVLGAGEWWRTAIFYQIYPRSFMDSDNDGVGDIKGIASKVDYLAELGITGAWLSPVYKSPMVDFGYDISNFTDVDPLFGNLQDLISLIAALQAKGIKVIMDFVPNHSSIDHPWFNMSVNRQGNYTDYYVWHDQSGTNNSNPIRPNNWLSNFSTPAWEWNEVREQYYLHQFGVKQPDLNFRNENVVKEMQDAMQFWLDLGVDGLRIDSVKFLVEDDQFRNETVIDQTQPVTYNNLDHNYTTNLNMTYTIVKGWADLIKKNNEKDNKERVLLLEVYDPIEQLMTYYIGDSAPFAIPFNFHLLQSISEGLTAKDLLNNINDWLTAMPKGGTSNWVVGNHDNNRVATRGGVEMVDSINMILAMLPGIMITFNGDEIGMTDTYLRFDETVDDYGKILGPDAYTTKSRDPERTPFQWDSTDNAGFCNCSKTWLPVNPNYWKLNVAAQKTETRSHLNVYKSLTKLRQSTTFLSSTTSYRITTPTNNTFMVERWSNDGETYVLIVNMDSYDVTTMYTLTNVTNMVVNVSSINSEYSTGDVVVLSEGVKLRAKAAVILQTFQATSSSVIHAISLTLLCFTLFMLLLS